MNKQMTALERAQLELDYSLQRLAEDELLLGSVERLMSIESELAQKTGLTVVQAAQVVIDRSVMTDDQEVLDRYPEPTPMDKLRSYCMDRVTDSKMEIEQTLEILNPLKAERWDHSVQELEAELERIDQRVNDEATTEPVLRHLKSKRVGVKDSLRLLKGLDPIMSDRTQASVEVKS